MMTNHRIQIAKALAAAIVGLVLSATQTHAAPVTVNNPGFDAQNSDIVVNGTTVITNWDSLTTSTGALVNSVSGTYTVIKTDGARAAWLNHQGTSRTLRQTTAEVITAGMTYTLTVDVGQSSFFSGSTATIRLFGSTAGYATALAETTGIAPAQGGWLTDRTVTFTATAGQATGQTLGIALIGTGGTQVVFDKVRLDASVGDTIAPTITSLSPADNATGVAGGANLVVTFNEPIAVGTTGNIILKNLTDATQTTIAITSGSPQVSVAGSVLTINPAADLTAGNYAIRIDAGALKDLAGNSFAGIADDTTWNFTPDLAPPTISSLSPANGAANVLSGVDLFATFNENIQKGSGNIVIRKSSDNSVFEFIDVTSAKVTVSGASMTINPAGTLAESTGYYVEIDSGAIKDLVNYPFAGVSGSSTWSFTTSSAGMVAKVFLLGGQSNMVGQAPSSGLPTSPVNLQQPQTGVLFYYSGSALTTLRPGSGGAPPPSGAHFGPEVTFGRAVADASPAVPYAIIKHGENGTALYNDWAPGTGASYTAFRNTVANGLAALQAAGYTTEIVGMLWHQGESDAIEGQQAAYGNNLTAFIADIRTRYGANLPFLIGEIRRSNGPAFVTVADAQMAVAAADAHADFVPASDLSFSDAYHFNAPSLMTLGERFAASYASLTGNTTPPTVSALSPSDGSENVAVGANLVATFSEAIAIAIGSGSITIKNLDTASQTLITLPDARVSVSGAVLTVNPSTNLAASTNHAVRISAGAITDLSSNPFGGIDNDTTWNFTTTPPDLTNPAVVSFNPADNATAVPLNANLVVTFNETIALGTGNITLKNLTDATQSTIAITDGTQVSLNGSVLTINPTADLVAGKSYAIRLDSGAIKDTANNLFTGIADDTTWSFTTWNGLGSILVANYSFDAQNSNIVVSGATPITGWDALVTSTGALATAVGTLGFATDGARAAWVNHQGTSNLLRQATGVVITAGRTYTLTVDVGVSPGSFYNSTATIRLFGSGAGYATALAETTGIKPGAPSTAGWLTNRTVTFTATAGQATGQTLGIALMSTAGTQVYFDNVRLEAGIGGGGTPFSDWAAGYTPPMSAGVDDGFGDDHDLDGTPNGHEFYFFDSDPAVAGAHGSPISGAARTAADKFEFTHNRRLDRTDVTETYQWSPDLDNWYDADGLASDGTHTVSVADKAVVAGPTANLETVTVEATVGGGTMSKLFLRLNLSSP